MIFDFGGLVGRTLHQSGARDPIAILGHKSFFILLPDGTVFGKSGWMEWPLQLDVRRLVVPRGLRIRVRLVVVSLSNLNCVIIVGDEVLGQGEHRNTAVGVRTNRCLGKPGLLRQRRLQNGGFETNVSSLPDTGWRNVSSLA